MRESKKKPEADLPATPKPAAGTDPGKIGRTALGPASPPTALSPMDRAPLDVLEAKLLASKDANERRELLEIIQRQFGNEKAAQIMRKLSGGKP